MICINAWFNPFNYTVFRRDIYYCRTSRLHCEHVIVMELARDEEESVQSMGLFQATRKQKLCNVAVRPP